MVAQFDFKFFHRPRVHRAEVYMDNGHYLTDAGVAIPEYWWAIGYPLSAWRWTGWR